MVPPKPFVGLRKLSIWEKMAALVMMIRFWVGVATLRITAWHLPTPHVPGTLRLIAAHEFVLLESQKCYARRALSAMGIAGAGWSSNQVPVGRNGYSGLVWLHAVAGWALRAHFRKLQQFDIPLHLQHFVGAAIWGH